MDIIYHSKIQKSFIEKFPTFKGSWLIHTNLLKLTPEIFRRCYLQDSGITLDLTDPAQLTIANIRKGKHEIGTVNFMRSHLKNGDVFIDVGANFGYFTAIASSLIGETGQVLAFEPNKNAYRHLINTITRNRIYNATPYLLALSNQKHSSMRMNQSWFRQTTSSYMSEGSSVLTNTLDSMIEPFNLTHRIKIIKIDVEGAELPVLQGMEKLLINHSPYIIVEPDMRSLKRFGYKFENIISYLDNLNYKPKYYLDPIDKGHITPFINGVIKDCAIVFEKN